MNENIIEIAIIVGVVLALIFQIFLYFIIAKTRYKKMENKMVENSTQLVGRLDYLENKLKIYRGAGKMNEDTKKLAKYFSKKLEELKEDMKEFIEDKFSELLAEEPDDQDEQEEEKEDLSEFDEDNEKTAEADFEDEFEYEGDRKVKSEIEPEKDLPPPKPKKKKKGLFSKKEKPKEVDEEF